MLERNVRLRTMLFAAALTLAGCSPMPDTLQYPQTKKVDHIDDYHGVKVADPYRWLEDDTSPETAAWVEAENKVTQSYLSRIPYREALKKRIRELENYPKYEPPIRRGELLFFSKNDGLQNQKVWYVQEGMDGEPKLLLDPNAISPDGTTRLDTFMPSGDGKYVAYALSDGGSDWKLVRVMDVATKTVLSDEIRWVKVSDLAWAENGFFYSRYPKPEGDNLLSAKNENHQVYFHKVGDDQTEDDLVYEDLDHAQRFHTLQTTEDERYALLTISERGAGLDGNSLFYKDLSKPTAKFLPVVEKISNDAYELVGSAGDGLLIKTNAKAANGKVLRFDLKSHKWSEILPEQPEPLTEAHTGGGRIFATYLKDVAARVVRYSLDGTKEADVELPGLGDVEKFGGQKDDTSIFYSFVSFNQPSTVYRYDIASGKSSVYRSPELAGLDLSQFETKQVFVTSKDGTKVPLFLVHKKGITLDGNNPALLYGYGGFNIIIGPSFTSYRMALLEQGFVYASCNMRGGGEYGETWHEAGTKLKKQNVFDDFIACAEWLVANKYSKPERMAAQGGSNGGLLVGAVINQRPELFRAAIPMVGVMDMLRFHKFTIGWNWIPDYGSSDNPEEFKALYAYSPIQNVKEGQKYPATLITTADHDDRVVPAHSFKYAATMQEKASKENPVLIRIETKSGHGASNTEKSIATYADVYSFLMYELGVKPKL